MRHIVASIVMAVLLIATMIHQQINRMKQKLLFNPVREHVWDPLQDAFSTSSRWDPLADPLSPTARWSPSSTSSQKSSREESSRDSRSKNSLNFEDLMLPSGKENIHAWFFKTFKDKPVILFCHSNTGNISHRKYMVDFCQTVGLNLFLFDYAGYGKSTGFASLRQLEKDGLVAYDYVIKFFKADQIIVWGKSMGGHVASYIAANRPCRILLLMATFSGLDHIVRYKDYPKWLKSIIANIIFYFSEVTPNYLRVLTVKCPVCIVHSKNDDLIPYQCAERLYESAPDKKLLIPIRGGHASPIMTISELEKIFQFCDICPNQRTGLSEWLNHLSTLSEKLGL